MKRKKWIALLLTFALLTGLSGCVNGKPAQRTTAASSTEPTTHPAPTTVAYGDKLTANKQVTLNLDDFPIVFDETDRDAYNKNGGFAGDGSFCNQLIFDSFGFSSIPEERSNHKLWGYYDIKKGKTVPIAPTQAFFHVTSRQHEVIMHETDYYSVWDCTGNADEPDVRLFKVSAKDNTANEIKSIPNSTVFVSLVKLDEHRFLYTTYERDENTKLTASVYCYDSRTDTDKVLLTESFFRLDDKQDSEGFYLEEISVSDGIIYGLLRSFTDEKDHYTIRLYNQDGKKIKDIPADSILKYTYGTNTISFHVHGNYCFLNSYDSYFSGAIYQLTDQGAVPALLSCRAMNTTKMDYKLARMMQNVYSTEKCPYAVYQEVLHETNSLGTVFSVLNVLNGKVTDFQVTTKSAFPYLSSYIRMDENGNILLDMNDKRNQYPEIVYYIDSEYIKANIL